MAETTIFDAKALEIAFEIVLSTFGLKDRNGGMMVVEGAAPLEEQRETALNVAKEVRAVYAVLIGKRR